MNQQRELPNLAYSGNEPGEAAPGEADGDSLRRRRAGLRAAYQQPNFYRPLAWLQPSLQ